MRFAVLATLLLLSSAPAMAKVAVDVDISTQTMSVTWPGGKSETWSVSTGRTGFETVRGTFGVTRLSKNHWSRKYDAAMPYAIFFHGGYALHASTAGRLGRPASHGCVRIAPEKAARLFEAVRRHGASITVSGSIAEFARANPGYDRREPRSARVRALPRRDIFEDSTFVPRSISSQLE